MHVDIDLDALKVKQSGRQNSPERISFPAQTSKYAVASPS